MASKGRPSTATKDGRTCSVCKVFKAHDQFPPDSRYAFGSHTRCRECNRKKGIKDREAGIMRRANGLPSGRKKCTECGQIKDVSEFNLSAHGSMGRQAECRECYRHTNRKCVFGITRQEFESLLRQQNNRCAICRQPETHTRYGRITALAVDHNHTTGAVRGLLCYNCNVRLAHIENRAWLAAAQRYLSRFS